MENWKRYILSKVDANFSSNYGNFLERKTTLYVSFVYIHMLGTHTLGVWNNVAQFMWAWGIFVQSSFCSNSNQSTGNSPVNFSRKHLFWNMKQSIAACDHLYNACNPAIHIPTKNIHSYKHLFVNSSLSNFNWERWQKERSLHVRTYQREVKFNKQRTRLSHWQDVSY